MKTYDKIFGKIIHPVNLFRAWEEFVIGKKKKADVITFAWHLEENIFDLCQTLKYHNYKHNVYHSFFITDPKLREIHKATVRDRVLHHGIFRILNQIFEPTFINDSFSCRIGKGNHKGVKRLTEMIGKVSKNHTGQCFILKCDIKKFFASIDHQTLKTILSKHLDRDVSWLLSQIINSFHTQLSYSSISNTLRQAQGEKGLPLGNLTSQLLVNIYMNEFDRYVKYKLKVKYYIRYADDFVILSQNKTHLTHMADRTNVYLREKLKLELHPNKVSITTLFSGMDFLGWVHFPSHRVLRTTTKRRMMKNLANNLTKETRTSYFGMLKHGNTWKLRKSTDLV